MVCPFGRPSTKPARRVGERVSDFGFDQQGRLCVLQKRASGRSYHSDNSGSAGGSDSGGFSGGGGSSGGGGASGRW
ncbi:hypothetical protein E5P20_11030 [Escherichia coli]|nr:hypothetical protein E5P18_09930 [Escherichia coli]TGW48095.1 hypothetical protein E5P20_11030 [Escherichia coli]